MLLGDPIFRKSSRGRSSYPCPVSRFKSNKLDSKMDRSLTNYELNESVLLKSDSEHSSDKNSEPDAEIDDYALNNGSSDTSIEDFDNNLPDTVTLLKNEKAKVYLIGTAHFSRESQQDVEKVIHVVKPDILMVELCKSRSNMLTVDEEAILKEAQEMNFQKIMETIRSNGIYNGIMYVLLLNTSAQITRQTGMAPGGEFRVAYREARKLPHCRIQLGDRPIHITLKRALGRLTWFQTAKLTWQLLTTNEVITPEEIERCKQRDILEQLITELAGEYPALRSVFLDERDIFLTHALQTAACSFKGTLGPQGTKARISIPTESTEPLKVVGVVGIGHVPGITKLWPIDQSECVLQVMAIPPPSVTSRAVKLTFRVSLITLGSYLVYRYVPMPKSLVDYARQGFHQMLLSLQSSTSNYAKFTVVN